VLVVRRGEVDPVSHRFRSGLLFDGDGTGWGESHRWYKSLRRKPGDSGFEYRPTCHADPVPPNDAESRRFRSGLLFKRDETGWGTAPFE